MLEKLFCLVGASGAGKDMLAEQIHRTLDIPKAVSYTTRPTRESELNGIDYNFISKEEFFIKLGNKEFAEFYETKGKEVNEQGEVFENTWYYGFTKEELEKAPYVLAIITPDGLEQIEQIYGDKIVSIFVSANENIRKERALNRTKGDEAEIERRFISDRKDFANITCNYIVYNESDIKEAVKDLRHIILIETSLKAH